MNDCVYVGEVSDARARACVERHQCERVQWSTNYTTYALEEGACITVRDEEPALLRTFGEQKRADEAFDKWFDIFDKE